MKLKAGHVVAERYVIDDIIGSGGMSVVYRAHDLRLDRYITLKILKEDYLTDENLIERFPKEARAAAALNHQNIVSIFDHGRDGDILYIVLEYVDGASLKELINKKAPFDDETNLGVTIQVTEGLSEAHRNNIIHLDIKPQNILITTTSVVKVADFGIARAAKSVTLNAAAGSMGSVHYFSPEQARGGYIDHKSDIYSLGIVMFEMATGRLPFDGENEVSVALQHINDPLPDILELNPDVSPSVVKIIQKATEKSASKRYQTIDDMTEDLKRALTDASGAFVEVEEEDDKSPTRTISEENREAIRREKMRAAFLDGEETPDEPEEKPIDGFVLHGEKNYPQENYPEEYVEPHEYQEGQEYGDYDDDYPEYTNYTEEFNYEDYVEPPPPPRDKKADRVAVYSGIIMGLVLGAIIIFVGWHLWRNVFSSAAGMVETPDVIGMTWDDALFHTRLVDLVPSREEPDQFCGYMDNAFCAEFCRIESVCDGLVIFQRTDPGRLLSPNDLLHIVVSGGAPGEMPRLIHRTYDDARAELDALDLDLQIERSYFDSVDYPRNTVLDQFPPPHEHLERGATVTLYVATGPDTGMVTVPSLIGLSEAEAEELLERYSLAPGFPSLQASDGFAAGFIIGQDPAAGEIVERNSFVSYIISSGMHEPIPTPTPPEDPPEPDYPHDLAGDSDTDPPPDHPDAPEVMTGTLVIHLWPIAEDTEYVHIYISRQMGDGIPETLFNDPDVPVSRFPVILQNIEFIDPTVFRIYSYENGIRTPRATENWPLTW